MTIRPLEGVRVLDFTHGVAGPYCTMVLGDLGADVIKVEKPKRGDATRYMNVSDKFAADIPRIGGDYFLAVNRNKRSVTIDMKQPEGRDLCLELAKHADVTVQNFRPGVMGRLGLDYSSLRRQNPKLICANLSAWGQTGALSQHPGMDVAVQARSGLMSITGVPGSDEPVRPGASLADFGGGIYLVAAVLTALYHRERTGEGQEVNVSLFDATMSLLSNYAVAVLDGDAELGRMGSGHPQLVPYQAFPTADTAIVISAGTNKIYREMCAVMGCQELADDPRFESNPDRVKNRDVLVPILSEITRSKSMVEWVEIFEAGGIPCAPVNDMKTAYSDLAETAEDMVCEINHPEAGQIHVTGVPFKFSNMAGDIRRHPPMLGEHTAEILGDLLALGDKEIESLSDRGVI